MFLHLTPFLSSLYRVSVFVTWWTSQGGILGTVEDVKLD